MSGVSGALAVGAVLAVSALGTWAVLRHAHHGSDRDRIVREAHARVRLAAATDDLAITDHSIREAAAQLAAQAEEIAWLEALYGLPAYDPHQGDT